MSKYKLRFWFEHGGYCLWGMNDEAKEKYGYPIENHALPISEALTMELNALEKEYATYLNWDCPQDPSLWTKKHKADFLNRATSAYEKLKYELGSDFEISNEVGRSVELGSDFESSNDVG
ncbi:MAG: hypothetical protein LBG71_08135 [Clostridiales Family XIII bacterium]|jgi:hypothetical protein|nr:hypothetical protein [Clostridiales Family XIII bacterium]